MDIPNSIEELFSNGNQNYYLSDYDLQPMDNIESMEYFLEQVGVDNDNICFIQIFSHFVAGLFHKPNHHFGIYQIF